MSTNKKPESVRVNRNGGYYQMGVAYGVSKKGKLPILSKDGYMHVILLR